MRRFGRRLLGCEKGRVFGADQDGADSERMVISLRSDLLVRVRSFVPHRSTKFSRRSLYPRVLIMHLCGFSRRLPTVSSFAWRCDLLSVPVLRKPRPLGPIACYWIRVMLKIRQSTSNLSVADTGWRTCSRYDLTN